MEDIKYGEIIKKHRKLNKLTQKQLGDKLQVSHATVARYESDEIKPTFSTIDKLRLILGDSFYHDVIKSQLNNIREQVSSTNNALDSTLAEEIDDAINDPDLEMNSIFRIVLTELGYKYKRNSSEWKIYNESSAYYIQTDYLRQIYRNYIEQLKSVMSLMLDGRNDVREETEEKTE